MHDTLLSGVQQKSKTGGKKGNEFVPLPGVVYGMI